jgi:S1-C subfamily serine protease
LSLVQAIERIRPSIVQIIFSATGLSQELRQKVGAFFLIEVLGTGFFINSDAYVITARHVLQHGREYSKLINAENKSFKIALGLPNSDNFIANKVLVDFNVIDEDSKYDLALLRLRRNPFQGEVSSGIQIGEDLVPVPAVAVQLYPERPQEGQWIGVSGYPLRERVLVTNSGYVASVWTIPNYLADVEVNRGNSGGPVYLVDESGVIGVCVASKGSPIFFDRGQVAKILDQELYYSSGLTHVVPSTLIIELLERNKIHYVTTRK